MAGVPTSRAEFRETILQNLGKGIHKIEVTDDQIENRIAFTLKKGLDYHFDFAQDTFFAKSVTADDIANKYFDLPENATGAVEIFPLVSSMMGGGIFNAQFQFVMQNIWEWQAASMIPYFVGFQQMQFIERILVGMPPVRYNRYLNRIHIDMAWDRVIVGDYIMVKCYQAVDPDTYVKMWSDSWLQEYATALVKLQWGTNIGMKYGNVPTIGGLTLNGNTIRQEAQEEIRHLEEKLIRAYSLPVDMLVG